MPSVCITQTSHCPWWVWLRRKTLRTWLVQPASHFVPRGEIKILEPQAQVNVATFLKHPDVRVAVSEPRLQLSEQHYSRCYLGALWTEEGLQSPSCALLLHACAAHSSSSTTAVPAPLISSPLLQAPRGFQHLDNMTIFGRLHHPPTSPKRASSVVKICSWEAFY